jgi:hypothetical protein
LAKSIFGIGSQKGLEKFFKYLLNWAILYNYPKIIAKLSSYGLIKNLTEALVYAIQVESLEGTIELLKSPYVDQINLNSYSEILNSLEIPKQIQFILDKHTKNITTELVNQLNIFNN